MGLRLRNVSLDVVGARASCKRTARASALSARLKAEYRLALARDGYACMNSGFCLVRAMPYYLVSATPKTNLLDELEKRLAQDEFVGMQPFGRALTKSLRDARIREDGEAIWEEEDYCRPPLAEERAPVLDSYFDNLKVEVVREGRGWQRITDLPRLFPELAE